jgi:hypothetical protein
MSTATQEKIELLKEWNNFEVQEKRVLKALRLYLASHRVMFAPSGDISKKYVLKPLSQDQMLDTLGLAYTSTSDFAGLWICGGGELIHTPFTRFIGFAISEGGDVYGIVWDSKENETLVKL